jgi:hypothetical protein
LAPQRVTTGRAAAESGKSSLRQPPYDQDDYDEDSNPINDIHGATTFSSALGASARTFI